MGQAWFGFRTNGRNPLRCNSFSETSNGFYQINVKESTKSGESGESSRWFALPSRQKRCGRELVQSCLP